MVRPRGRRPRPTTRLDVVVFGAAPRELTGVISLQQTVELVRLSIRVVETNIDALLDPEDAREVHDAVLLYAREVAFATAAVYARAAESRGAWDARLEALVVDAVVRAEADETVLSRASALGWGAHGDVAVVLGAVPPAPRGARRLRVRTPLGARRRHGRALRHPGRAARRRARRGDRPAQGGDPAARPLRRRPGRRRAGHRRPRPRQRVGARRPLGPPGRQRLARRPAPGREPRPAARARAGRRRPRPAPPGRRGLPPADGRPRHAAGDARRLVRARLVDRGHGPRALRAPQHGALPAAPGLRAHRLVTDRARARPSRSSWR